ncbi:MAG: zinc ribbon domain-containing protein [Gemmatimonadaceae bacterium]|nr:zinc ribbon domain-containing protein [Gemmatimonadaceae bacterium]
MDAFDLLFRRIVLAAQAQGALERPVTVGEILETLAPYAAARRDGALDTLEDYLHALTRLVSGEGDRMYGDDLMQDDLKAELVSTNPDLQAVRTYAQSKVRLSSAAAAEVLAGDTAIDLTPPTPLGVKRVSGASPAQGTGRPSGAAPAARPSAAAPRPSGAGRPAGATPTEPRASPAVSAGGRPAAPAADDGPTEPRPDGALQEAYDAYAGTTAADATHVAAVTGDGGCPYCAEALPSGRAVKFCPACGQNLLVRRCPGCSAEIESGWKFCVTCGRKA